MKKLCILTYSFLLALLFIVLFFRPITAINEDLSRHILLGKIIVTTHAVPKVNLFSYAFTNFPFVNTTWLSAVIFYLLTKLGGFNSLILLNVIVMAGAFVVQLKYAYKRFSYFSILSVTTAYIILLSVRTDVRPEIFSALLISIFCIALFSHREKPSKKVYGLILLEAFWVNLQIYFIVGPVLVLLFTVDAFLVTRKISKNVINLFTLFVLVSLVTLINPNGIKGAVYPFIFSQNYGLPVNENQNIFVLYEIFNSPSILLPVIGMVLIGSLLVLGRKKVRLIDLLLFILFGVASIVSFRNILPFVFATFIPSIFIVDIVSNKFSKKIKKFPKYISALLFSVLIFCLLVVIAKSIIVQHVGFGVVDKGKKSVDYLQNNNIGGLYFNNFNIGGYLVYRMYPQQIFVDSRPEAYPKSFFKNTYIPMQRNPEIFKSLDEKFHFNAVIFAHYDGLADENILKKYLLEKSEFKLVYFDPYAFVMVRNVEKNRHIIKRDEISLSSIHFKNINDPEILISYILFYEQVGMNKKGEEGFRRLKKIDPMLCVLQNHPVLKISKISYIHKEDFQRCGSF